MCSPDNAGVWPSLGATGYKNKVSSTENNTCERPGKLDGAIGQ